MADNAHVSVTNSCRSSIMMVKSGKATAIRGDGTSPSTGEVALPTSERTPSTCPIKILTPVLDFFPGTEFF